MAKDKRTAENLNKASRQLSDLCTTITRLPSDVAMDVIRETLRRMRSRAHEIILAENLTDLIDQAQRELPQPLPPQLCTPDPRSDAKI